MYIDIVIDYHQKSGNRQIGVCRFIALTRRNIPQLKWLQRVLVIVVLMSSNVNASYTSGNARTASFVENLIRSFQLLFNLAREWIVQDDLALKTG